MNRLEDVRRIVDKRLEAIENKEECRNAFTHLYGVSDLGGMIALKRGLNAEYVQIAGMLHDLYAYETGDRKDHGQKGAELARRLLTGMKSFGGEEVHDIYEAIVRHSDKAGVHTDYAEALKDADVFQHYLYNTGMGVEEKDRARLQKLTEDFGLPQECVCTGSQN